MKKNLSWTQFNKYLYKSWKLWVAVIFLELFILPLNLINPYLTKLVIDKAYGNKDLKLFLILAIIGGSIFILSGIMISLSGYLLKRINRKVHFDIMKDLFRHLQSLSMSFFNNKSTGNHIYMISNDVQSLSEFVCYAVPEIIALFFRFLFIWVIVFYLNWKFALLVALLVPIGCIQPYFLGKWVREVTLRTIEKSQDIFEKLCEVFSHILLIKAGGKENHEIKRFEENIAKNIDFEIERVKLSAISGFLNSVLNKVLGGVIALYGGYQVIGGTMSLGSLTAVMIYLTQLIGLAKSMGDFYEKSQVNQIACQRIAEILDIPPQIKDAPGSRDYRILQGRIEFKGVHFGYNKDEFVLKDINFSIEPASKISLVGKSGSGKTTLLNLILRLYEIDKGDILIDGLNIRGITLKSLKEQIGIALQEAFLWNDTISNNILYGLDRVDKVDMIKAAQIAQAHDFIMGFPQQYDSIIGEMACKISEGQKQRIAIARAVIKKPKILFLDEAMSSLDSETEDKIMDNIRSEFRDSTVIVVSHRLSTVKKMDKVYFLRDSGHMEIGTHPELSERILEYKELFSSQIQEQEGVPK